jgi:hypothetical protein
MPYSSLHQVERAAHLSEQSRRPVSNHNAPQIEPQWIHLCQQKATAAKKQIIKYLSYSNSKPEVLQVTGVHFIYETLKTVNPFNSLLSFKHIYVNTSASFLAFIAEVESRQINKTWAG